MATNDLFTDTQSDSDGWSLAAGFFVLVLVGFAVLETEIGLIPEGARPVVLSLLFIILPLLLGLTNAIRGYAYSSSIGIGVSPIVAWLIVTIGRVFLGAVDTDPAVLIGIAVVFTVGGVFAALGGFAIGYAGRVAAAKYAES